MSFRPHSSKELTELFKRNPYQGQNPKDARIVFLSSDANYSPEISEHSFFKYILEYQKDGVAFWRKYGVHHPFLLENYPFNKTQNGRPFHNNFRKLGLGVPHAAEVSFVELLNIPTIGNKSDNKSLFYKLSDTEYLKSLDRLITTSKGKLILVPKGVLRDMLVLKGKYGVFNWMPRKLPAGQNIFEFGSNRLIEIYHFSSSHIHNQLPIIRDHIDNWLKV